ncbi:MAG: hypothetical protein KJO64_06450, partial [Bacteroidia bacterium]|nr:hypothetical protein [Bacteroidia bacterium]
MTKLLQSKLLFNKSLWELSYFYPLKINDMLRTILFLAFLLFQVQVFAQNPPFPIANIGGLNLNIATDTCFSGAPITSLSPGQKLVSSETLSSNCGIWQRVSIPSVSQHTDTSGYICG